uniref:Peptidase S1 domain-containing protein n=1 Tax=Anopheles farauti TaxID=69004 RepID=A0A182QZB2_9DIPT
MQKTWLKTYPKRQCSFTVRPKQAEDETMRSAAPIDRSSVLLLCVAVCAGVGAQSNITLPQPFNVSLVVVNQTLPSNSLPPLATVPPVAIVPGNTSARWEPIPHYKHPHYDGAGKVLWFPRIIGGSPATKGEFPAMVSLQLARNAAHVCGGTLVTMSHVLTAAHCVTDVRGVPHPASQYQVMADDLQLPPHTGNPTVQIRPVRSITVHPMYDSATIANDIAIARVATEFRKTETLFPGKRIQKAPTLGDRCSLAGWGVTDERSTTMSPYLQRINVVISDFGTCSALFDNVLRAGMLCAGAPGRDACQGDSGGGLLCSGGRVAGIVSFGAGCAIPNVPGVYVDVAYYEKWINGVLKNGSEGRQTIGNAVVGVLLAYWILNYLAR